MAEVGFAIATAAAAAGASNAIVTAIVVNAALVGNIAIAAASFAYQSSQARKARSGRFQTNVNDNNGLQQPIKQPIPPQRLVLGEVTSSGALFFTKGTEETRPYLYFGILLAAHKTDGLRSLFINNTEIFLDESGFATSTPFNDGVTKFIQASYRDGDINQEIDPIIDANFPDIPSTFRQRGHTTLVTRAHFGTGANDQERRDKNQLLYGDQGFNPLVRFGGALVYDPRDPTQVLGDEDTYKFSRNASLNIMHYYAWQYPQNADKIDWEKVALAADVDDQTFVTKAGKILKKGTIDGIIRSVDSPFDVFQSALSSNGGRLVVNNGTIFPFPAQRQEPVATLHKDNVLQVLGYSAYKSVDELINTVKTEFLAKDRDNKRVVGPVVRNQEYINADGVERIVTLNLTFTEGHERAQMIANRVIEESRLQKTLSVSVGIEALPWIPGQVLTLDFHNEYSIMNGTYEIVQKDWNEQLSGYTLSLTEHSNSVFDYDAATQEQDFVLDEDTLEAA